MITIKPITMSSLRDDPALAGLIAEYDQESRNPGVPDPDPDWNLYFILESANMIFAFGAYTGAGELIGAISVLTSSMTHVRGFVAGRVETYFVKQSHRKGGAGVLLLREAERTLKARGISLLFVTAPIGGRLDAALPMWGYQQTNHVYCRSLEDRHGN